MDWYYVEHGQKVGPVDETELEQRYHARIVAADTLVWHEGADKWKMLCEFPEFKIASPSASQPPMSVPPVTAQMLSLDKLRDPSEKTALTALWIFAAPVYLVLLTFMLLPLISGKLAGLASLLMTGFVVGAIWLAKHLGEYFAAAYIKSNSIRVSENQLPEIHHAAKHCAELLGVKLPEVYVMQESLWNAFAAKLAGQRIVVLFSGAIDSILLKGDMKQLTWVVGHEIGHHAAGHLNLSHTLARVGAWAPWFYLWYRRRSELTCDRIGLYCVGEERACLLALANLTAGAQLADKVNISAAIVDWQNYEREFFIRYRTFYSAYPPNLSRLHNLHKSAVEFGMHKPVSAGVAAKTFAVMA